MEDDTAQDMSSTMPSADDGADTGPGDGQVTGPGDDSSIPQIQRELVRGARICFHFDQGRYCGVYIGPSTRRADAGQELHKVSWDDGTNYLVQLKEHQRHAGDDVATMEPGQWAIV